MWYILGFPPLRWKSNIALGTVLIPLVHVIDQLNIYIDRPDGGNRTDDALMRLCFAKFSVWHYKETMALQNDIRVPFIEPLLRNHELIGSWEPLEFLIRIVLVFRIGMATTMSDDQQLTWPSGFPFFADSSFLKKQPLTKCSTTVSFLPIMSTDPKLPHTDSDQLEALKATPEKLWLTKVPLYL